MCAMPLVARRAKACLVLAVLAAALHGTAAQQPGVDLDTPADTGSFAPPPGPTLQPVLPTRNIPANVLRLVDSLLEQANPSDVPPDYTFRFAFASKADQELLPPAFRPAAAGLAEAAAASSSSGSGSSVTGSAAASSSSGGSVVMASLRSTMPVESDEQPDLPSATESAAAPGMAAEPAFEAAISQPNSITAELPSASSSSSTADSGPQLPGNASDSAAQQPLNGTAPYNEESEGWLRDFLAHEYLPWDTWLAASTGNDSSGASMQTDGWPGPTMLADASGQQWEEGIDPVAGAGSGFDASSSSGSMLGALRRKLAAARKSGAKKPAARKPAGKKTAKPQPYRWVPPNPALKRRIVGITVAFENNSRRPQYGFAKYLGDGRGITFGRCGFCTGTGDGLRVVGMFSKYRPRSKLASYLPALQAIMAAGGGDNIKGLEGFEAAVATAAADPAFRYVQDLLHEIMYWRPAMTLSSSIGVKFGITKGQIYDAWIQHGWSDSLAANTVGGIAKAAIEATGGRPIKVDEVTWLSNFMKIRHDVLTGDSQVWQNSASRVEIYKGILEKRNLPLRGPIRVWSVVVP